MSVQRVCERRSRDCASAADAPSYLSASADCFILVDLEGFFRMLSACVCPVCRSVCVFLASVCVCACRRARAAVCPLGFSTCASVHIEMCKNVCGRQRGHRRVLVSSDQTRRRGGESRAPRRCCGAVSDLGHGLGLRLNEKWNGAAAGPCMFVNRRPAKPR